ncbi:sensor histidine kinase, partial [Clostridioides difficile]|nr:sensor histidine kinase [Clostridioides difficile]
MLVKYLKGRSKYIALHLVVVSIINIYLFAIDIFKNKYSELIYLDFLVLFIIMVFFVIDYINFRNSYTNLYNCIENSGEID